MPMFDSVDGDPGYQSSFERFVSRQPVKIYSKRRPFGRTPSKNVEPILERLERLSPKKSKDVAEDENVLNERRRSVPVPRYGPPISPPLADKFKSIILESEKEARTIDDEKSVLDCSRRRSSRTAKQRSSTDSVFDSFACMADKSESESIAGSEKMAAPKNEPTIESSQDSGFGSQDSRESEARIIKLVYVPKSIGKTTVDANFNSKNGLRRSTRPNSSTSSEDDNLPLAALAAKNGIRRKSGGKMSISEPEYVVGDSSRDGMNLHDLIQARAKEIFTTLEMVERRSSPRKATETKILSFVPAVSPAKDASVLTDKIETVAEPESTKTDILQKTEEVTVADAKDLPTNNDNEQKTSGSSASHLRSIQLKDKRKTPPKTQKFGTENASPPKSPRNKLKHKRLLNFLPFKEKLRRLRIAEAEAAERRAALALKNEAKSAGDIAQESCPDSGKAKPVKPKVTAAASMPKPKPAKAPKRKFDGSSCDLPKNKRRKTVGGSSASVLTQVSKELKITNNESNKVTMTITATSNTDEVKSEKLDVSTPLEIITTPEKLGEIESPAVSPNGTRRKHTTPKKLTDYDCRRRSRSSLGASYHDAEKKSKPKPKVKKEESDKRYSGFYTDGEPYNIMYRLIKIRNSMSRDELDLNQNDKKSS